MLGNEIVIATVELSNGVWGFFMASGKSPNGVNADPVLSNGNEQKS